jgi:microcystin-dependent protein
MPSPPSDPNDLFMQQQDAFDRRLRALETALAGSGALPAPTPSSAYLQLGQAIWTPVAQVPAGFLEANGQFVSKVTYAALFGIYGVTFGDGGTTFGLPDLKRRFPMGRGTGYAASENDGQAEATRGPKHHHRLTAGVSMSVSIGAVSDHQHPAVGGHIHGTPSGAMFATTGLGLTGAAGTARYVVADGYSTTDTQGGHQHGAAGGHGHSASGSGSVDADTSGGGIQDTVGYLVGVWLVRAV